MIHSLFPSLRGAPLAIAALAIAAGGCSRRESAVDAGVRTGTLLIGNFAEPLDLDPQVAYAATDFNIIGALFEGLTVLDERTSRALPGVAESWEASPDGLVYTFHLRADARWSDGDPVTARDFLFSFQRILTPAFAATYSYMLWPIRNAEAFNAGKITDFSQVGVRALNERTFQVTLTYPTPYLPALAAHNTWMPVQRKTIERFGPAAKKGTAWTRPGNLVSDGPFMLSQWIPNSRIGVVRNPRYWDNAKSRLNRIEFFPIENAETEELAFRAGQLHLTYDLPVSKIATYRNETPPQLRIDPLLAEYFLVFNTTRPPFDRPKLRRALALAIDREQLCRDVMSGSRIAAHSATPPNCGGYTARAAIPNDFEEARRLLAEAGFPGGRGLPTFELQSYSDNMRLRTMEAIQARWKIELGIHITITPIEQKTLFQNQQTLNYQIGLSGWTADYPDPTTFLDTYMTGNGNNFTGWSDAAYDKLVQEAHRTADPARRFEWLQQAEARLLDQAPMAPLFFWAQVYALHPAVRGWEPSALNLHQLKNVWLEKR